RGSRGEDALRPRPAGGFIESIICPRLGNGNPSGLRAKMVVNGERSARHGIGRDSSRRSTCAGRFCRRRRLGAVSTARRVLPNVLYCTSKAVSGASHGL